MQVEADVKLIPTAVQTQAPRESFCPNFHSFHGIRVGNMPHVDRIHLHELMIRVSNTFWGKGGIAIPKRSQ